MSFQVLLHFKQLYCYKNFEDTLFVDGDILKMFDLHVLHFFQLLATLAKFFRLPFFQVVFLK